MGSVTCTSSLARGRMGGFFPASPDLSAAPPSDEDRQSNRDDRPRHRNQLRHGENEILSGATERAPQRAEDASPGDGGGGLVQAHGYGGIGDLVVPKPPPP